MQIQESVATPYFRWWFSVWGFIVYQVPSETAAIKRQPQNLKLMPTKMQYTCWTDPHTVYLRCLQMCMPRKRLWYCARRGDWLISENAMTAFFLSFHASKRLPNCHIVALKVPNNSLFSPGVKAFAIKFFVSQLHGLRSTSTELRRRYCCMTKQTTLNPLFWKQEKKGCCPCT